MTMNTIEALHVACPRALEMARRLEFAVQQLKAGQPRRVIIRLVKDRYQCSRMTAWRVVDMANDVAVELR